MWPKFKSVVKRTFRVQGLGSKPIPLLLLLVQIGQQVLHGITLLSVHYMPTFHASRGRCVLYQVSRKVLCGLYTGNAQNTDCGRCLWIVVWCVSGENRSFRDWSLITGRGGGVENGKIAGPKHFVPPPLPTG